MHEAARLLYERWFEFHLMLRPSMVAALRALSDAQALNWCEQARAIGLGGEA